MANFDSLSGDELPITEYFTPAGLEYFLSVPASKKTKAGLLQGFVPPKGASNFVIRAAWTPDDCAMDSCININKLADPDLGAQERAATNDERNCVLIPLAAGALAAQLRRACGCIAEHIAEVGPAGSAVTRMTLLFKIDRSVRPAPRPAPRRAAQAPRPSRSLRLAGRRCSPVQSGARRAEGGRAAAAG